MTTNAAASATAAAFPLIVIRRRTWRILCHELRRRGASIRESGAFLLGAAPGDGPPRPRTVTQVAYYDDLDAHCLTGGISLAGAAYDRLWLRCEQDRLAVIADIHTHPRAGVDQSRIDATNPMMALPGHLALILGNYATGPTDPASVGTHVYRGAHTWQRIPPDERDQAIRLVGIDPFDLRTCIARRAPRRHPRENHR